MPQALQMKAGMSGRVNAAMRFINQISLPKLFDAFADEGMHAVRLQGRMGIDDMDGNWLRLELFEDIFQSSALSQRRHLVGKKHAESQPIDAGAQ